jgi:hypothetical protein
MALFGGKQDEKFHGLPLQLEATAGAAQFKTVTVQTVVVEFECILRHESSPERD